MIILFLLIIHKTQAKTNHQHHNKNNHHKPTKIHRTIESFTILESGSNNNMMTTSAGFPSTFHYQKWGNKTLLFFALIPSNQIRCVFVDDIIVSSMSNKLPVKPIKYNETFLVWAIPSSQFEIPSPNPNSPLESGNGILGLALAPDFEMSKNLYVYLGSRYVVNPTSSPTSSKIKQNQLVRVTLDSKKNFAVVPTSQRLIWRGNVLAGLKNGGGLQFDRDGLFLWWIVGQGDTSKDCQDVKKDKCKIFRIYPNGTFPKDNPGGNAYYAFGVRNGNGLTWDYKPPYNAFFTDVGPDCNDEINILQKGSNYGWGGNGFCSKKLNITTTNVDGPLPRNLPITWFKNLPQIQGGHSPIPTGLMFCNACNLGKENDGNLLVSFLNSANVMSLKLNGKRDSFIHKESKSIYLNNVPIVSVGNYNNQFSFSDLSGAIKLLKIKIIRK
jgi:glucose/arabinose dehydrogenase